MSHVQNNLRVSVNRVAVYTVQSVIAQAPDQAQNAAPDQAPDQAPERALCTLSNTGIRDVQTSLVSWAMVDRQAMPCYAMPWGMMWTRT